MNRPTRERRALDRLLAMFPDWDLLSIGWQLPTETNTGGPWLLVELGQRSDDGAEAWARHRYAIWKATGAVHGLDADGAAIDPPLIGEIGYHGER